MFKKIFAVALLVFGLMLSANVFAADVNCQPFYAMYDKDPCCFMTFNFCPGGLCSTVVPLETTTDTDRQYLNNQGTVWRDGRSRIEIVAINAPRGCPPGWICPEPATMTTDAAMPVIVPAGEFVVYFDFDKYKITSKQLPELEKALEHAKNSGATKITVVSYTDFRGSTEYNTGLGLRRAEAVENWFLANTADTDIVIVNNGAQEIIRPLVGKYCAECWQDRRVDITTE